MSKAKEGAVKLGAFFKKNIYIILIALSIAVIATMIGLAVGGVFDSNEPMQVVDEGNVPVEAPPAETPQDETPVDSIPDDKNPSQPEPIVVVPEPVVFALPVANATVGNGYTEIATVYYSSAKEYKKHLGIDYIAEAGTAVCAAYDGTVTSIVIEPIFDGNTITITHADGLVSVYASLGEEIPVVVGTQVRKGQTIGYVGTSMAIESAVGNHVHFEILENGVNVDPLTFLIAEEK